MLSCKKLRRKDYIAFAKVAIENLGLTNNEVMLHLYGGKKQCSDCNRPYAFTDRFCPHCGIPAQRKDVSDSVAA